MILQFLMSWLVVDIWHARRGLNAVTWLLIVHVLERVPVKVNRCRSVRLRCRLSVYLTELVRKAFETLTDFLSSQ